MNIQEPLHDDLPDLDCEESELIHQSFLESVARENRIAAWRRRRERQRRRRQGCVSSDSDMEGQNPTMPVQAPPATDDGGSKETTAPRETKSVSTLLLEALVQLVLKPGESLHLQKSAMPNDTATVDDLLAGLSLQPGMAAHPQRGKYYANFLQLKSLVQRPIMV